MKKYSVKNIGNAFSKAASKAVDSYKKGQAYKQSPEYKQKVLDNLDYQIKLKEKQQKLISIGRSPVIQSRPTVNRKRIQSRQVPKRIAATKRKRYSYQTISQPVQNREIWQEFS